MFGTVSQGVWHFCSVAMRVWLESPGRTPGASPRPPQVPGFPAAYPLARGRQFRAKTLGGAGEPGAGRSGAPRLPRHSREYSTTTCGSAAVTRSVLSGNSEASLWQCAATWGESRFSLESFFI